MSAATRYASLMGLTLFTGLILCFYTASENPDIKSDQTPDYMVSARDEVPDLGVVGAVLIPSLRRDDDGLELLFREIARVEGFTVAFYFSTREAVTAHRAATRDSEALDELRSGFLGRLTRGVFTPGAEIYP